MSSPGSVTRWLGLLRGGDPAAARGLWERYFRRLVGLARAKLGNLPRRVAVLKMEGYGNEEIKAELGCSLATVERKLALIRKAWEGEVAGA